MHKLLGFLLLMTGCGHKAGSSVAAATSPFEGSWITACAVTDATSQKATMSFTGSTRQVLVSLYSDNACSVISATNRANYTFVANGTTDTTIYNVDSTVVTNEVAYYGARLAAATTATAYGYTNWQEGVFQDIAGKKSQPNESADHDKGTTSYTILKIQGNSLLGADPTSGDGSAEASRPTKINVSNVAIRQ